MITITPEEKKKLQEIAEVYRNFEKTLAEIELEQEKLRTHFMNVIREIDSMKEKELALLKELEEKYSTTITANDLLEMLKNE